MKEGSKIKVKRKFLNSTEKDNREEKVKVIKEYTNYILVETKWGYRTTVNKSDLGLIKEMIEPPKSDLSKIHKI